MFGAAQRISQLIPLPHQKKDDKKYKTREDKLMDM